VIAIGLAFATSAGAVEAARRWLVRRAVLDVPTARSSHDAPVVRGGGIGVAAAIGVGWLITDLQNLHGWTGLLVAAVGFGAIGLLEDLRRDQPVLTRLGAQLATAAVAAVLLLDGAQGGLWLLGMLVTGWLVAFANIVNFMDGINGITALTTIVALASMALASAVAAPGIPAFTGAAAVAAAAAAGFLPHNFPVARIFLGDSGSYLLGAVLAGCVVIGARAGVSVVALSAPLVPYIVDSMSTIARRILRGERWWEPHREHAYQRLVIAGWSHGSSAIAMAVATAVAGAGGVAMEAGISGPPLTVTVAVLAALAYLSLPALASRRSHGWETSTHG
jgi:UDP-N-acetylmuramyl pentapeptide phosphotransferase/UDP-N-acetylglucosamine-1-phosphate transferase